MCHACIVGTPNPGWFTSEDDGARHYWDGNGWYLGGTAVDSTSSIVDAFVDGGFAVRAVREFAKLIRNPTAGIGQRVVVWGEVMQFDVGTGPDLLRADLAAVNTSEHGYFTGENCMLSPIGSVFEDLVAGDVFVAAVEVIGVYQYTSTFGGAMSAPWFRAHAVHLVDSD